MDRNTNNTTYSKTNMNNHTNGVNVSGGDVTPGTGLCVRMWRRVRSWYRSWKGARAVPYLRLYKYADSVDVVLMALGTLGGILNGISLPIMLLIQSHLIDNFGSHTNNPFQLQHKIAQDSLYFVFTALASWLACYLEVCCWMYAGERQASRIRSKYLQSILRQNVGFFDCETTTSEIVNSISADMLLVQEAISEKVGNFIKNFSHFVGGYIVAFSLLWKMASLMIPFTPILLLPGILYGVAIIEFTLRIQEAYAEANIVAEQAISSIRIVYSFVGEKRTLMAYYDSLSRVVDLGKKQGIAKGLAIGSHGIIFSMWSLLGWYGSILISHHQANGGQILTTGFAMITGGLALGNATPHIKTFFEGSVAAYKIFEMIDRVPLIDAYDNNGKEIENIQGDLEFNDVTFAYPSRSTSLILENLKLKVPKGKTMALVGSSGSGKSTVISLIVRYYDPLSGEILLDGVNIKHLKLKWLRQQIGLVSQEPTLFGTSIKENILYGKGDATMDEITRVAELVGAHQFISKLPNGYDTQVGDRGVQLSGGQRQRIAIARALLRNPAILLLDEATSALDSDSEKHVQKALENVLMQGGGRTTLVVAHRLSTIHTSDAIAVLHNGALAEIGTHEELLQKKDGAYASLVRSQQKPNNSDGRGGELWPQPESQMEKDFFISPLCPSSPSLQESLPETRFDGDNGESRRNLCTQLDQLKTEYNNKDFSMSTPHFTPSLSPSPQESLPQTGLDEGDRQSRRKLLTRSDQLKTEHRYNKFTISTPNFTPPPSPSPYPPPQESLLQTGFNGGDEEGCRKLPVQSDQSKTEYNKDFTIYTPPPPPQESLLQTGFDGGDRESCRKLPTPSEQPRTDNHKDLTISLVPFPPPSPSPSPYPCLSTSPYPPASPPQESLPQTGLNGDERGDGESHRKLWIVQSDQSRTENHTDSTISTPPFPPSSSPSPSPSPYLSPSPPQSTQDVLPQNGHRRKAMETSTAKKKNGHFRRFVALSKPEWKHVVLGIAGAIAFGLVQPIYAYIVGSMVSTFYSSDMEKMRERTRVYSLFFLFLTLASFLVNYLQQYHFAVVGENLTRRIREMMLEKVLSFELAWFDEREHSSGALCSRLSSDANMVRTLFGDRISLVVQTMSGILVSVIIAMFNCWKLALVMTATQPLIIYCYYHRKVAQTKFAQQEAKAQEQACQVASEAVALHRTITAFSAQDKVLSHFDDKLEGTRRQTLKRSISSGMTIGAAQFTLLASWGLDFWYGGKLVEQGEATFGDIFKTFFILVSIGRVLAEAGTLTPDFAKGSRAVEFVFSILDRATKIDGNNLPTNSMFGKQGEMEGHVEFREVDFAYPSRPNVTVFKNFNLKVSAGKTMALVGKSGCGKSTVISLMERFYDPLRGKVLVDGINIRDMHMHTLRQHIGLVNQEPTLFATSIRDNIAYGKEGCSEEEIYRAARAANAHDFISALPNGYLTYAGEQGLQLSGGQKQRIAIARAILKDPKILLLDEATSALDAESELVVQKALDSMMANRTTLVVAHRLSTIKHAHYISVIKDGCISEQGSHQDLITSHGDYYYLLQLQTTSLSSST